MNKDSQKRIIKSPFYSLEDFKKYSERLQRGLADIQTLKQNNTEEDHGSLVGSEFIGNDGKKYTIGEATIREIEICTDVKYHKINKEQSDKTWREIDERIKQTEERENNNEVLKEKAIILALFMVRHVRSQTEGLLDLFENTKIPSIPQQSDFVSLGELFIEIASNYSLFIDSTSHSLLRNKGDYELFYDTFQDAFIALALVANYGEGDAYAVQNAFVSDLNKCLLKYSKFFFEEGKNLKDDRLWELAKNLSIITNKENGVHNFFIRHLVLVDFARIIEVLEKFLK